ncbi:MAG: hypothetical protein ACXVIG_02995 [Halobacteriota archaeon]
MKCAKCGADVERTTRTCKRCGEALITVSQAGGKPPDSFMTSLIRGLHDHFNPALHAVDEAVSSVTKRSKQRR